MILVSPSICKHHNCMMQMANHCWSGEKFYNLYILATLAQSEFEYCFASNQFFWKSLMASLSEDMSGVFSAEWLKLMEGNFSHSLLLKHIGCMVQLFSWFAPCDVIARVTHAVIKDKCILSFYTSCKKIVLEVDGIYPTYISHIYP